MDLGLTGRIAFVAASTQGLGYACALSLAQEGARVTINGRSQEKLDQAVDLLRAEHPGAEVDGVVADISTEAGRERVLAALPETDVLVTNNAGPAPGSLEDWDEEALMAALQSNMIPAVQFLRAYIPGMRERKFGRIVNITSGMVKSPAYEMGLSTSARAGLTAISKSISREVIADNVTINNLLPERIDTPRQEFMASRAMQRYGITQQEARARSLATVPAGRFGNPAEFGDACAFLCSAQAGFITGQNLHVDGGAYKGLI